MEHNANKEKWISEVLDSVKGMSRADTDLYGRIMANLDNPVLVKPTYLPIKKLAAAAILLLALNAGSVLYFISQNKKTANTANERQVSLEIQQVITYNY